MDRNYSDAYIQGKQEVTPGLMPDSRADAKVKRPKKIQCKPGFEQRGAACQQIKRGQSKKLPSGVKTELAGIAGAVIAAGAMAAMARRKQPEISSTTVSVTPSAPLLTQAPPTAQKPLDRETVITAGVTGAALGASAAAFAMQKGQKEAIRQADEQSRERAARTQQAKTQKEFDEAVTKKAKEIIEKEIAKAGERAAELEQDFSKESDRKMLTELVLQNSLQENLIAKQEVQIDKIQKNYDEVNNQLSDAYERYENVASLYNESQQNLQDTKAELTKAKAAYQDVQDIMVRAYKGYEQQSAKYNELRQEFEETKAELEKLKNPSKKQDSISRIPPTKSQPINNNNGHDPYLQGRLEIELGLVPGLMPADYVQSRADAKVKRPKKIQCRPGFEQRGAACQPIRRNQRRDVPPALKTGLAGIAGAAIAAGAMAAMTRKKPDDTPTPPAPVPSLPPTQKAVSAKNVALIAGSAGTLLGAGAAAIAMQKRQQEAVSQAKAKADQELNNVRAQSQADLQRKETEIRQKAQTEVNQAVSKIKDQEGKIAESTFKISELENQLQETQSKHQADIAELNKVKQQSSQLKEESKQERSRLESEVKKSQDELSKTQESLKQQVSELEKVKSEYQGLKKEHTQLKSELDSRVESETTRIKKEADEVIATKTKELDQKYTTRAREEIEAAQKRFNTQLEAAKEDHNTQLAKASDPKPTQGFNKTRGDLLHTESGIALGASTRAGSQFLGLVEQDQQNKLANKSDRTVDALHTEALAGLHKDFQETIKDIDKGYPNQVDNTQGSLRTAKQLRAAAEVATRSPKEISKLYAQQLEAQTIATVGSKTPKKETPTEVRKRTEQQFTKLGMLEQAVTTQHLREKALGEATNKIKENAREAYREALAELHASASDEFGNYNPASVSPQILNEFDKRAKQIHARAKREMTEAMKKIVAPDLAPDLLEKSTKMIEESADKDAMKSLYGRKDAYQEGIELAKSSILLAPNKNSPASNNPQVTQMLARVVRTVYPAMEKIVFYQIKQNGNLAGRMRDRKGKYLDFEIYTDSGRIVYGATAKPYQQDSYRIDQAKDKCQKGMQCGTACVPMGSQCESLLSPASQHVAQLAAKTAITGELPSRNEIAYSLGVIAREFVDDPIKAIKQGFEREKLARQVYKQQTGKELPSKGEIIQQASATAQEKMIEVAKASPQYIKESPRHIKEASERALELAKAHPKEAEDLAVNTAGFVASKVGGVVAGPVGALAGDLGAAMVARKGITDYKALRRAQEKLEGDEAYQNADQLTKLKTLRDQSLKELELMKQEIKDNKTGDIAGWAIGNTTAAALNLIPGVSAIPFKGAAFAMATTPTVVEAKNRIEAGEDPKAVIDDIARKQQEDIEKMIAEGNMREAKVRAKANRQILATREMLLLQAEENLKDKLKDLKDDLTP